MKKRTVVLAAILFLCAGLVSAQERPADSDKPAATPQQQGARPSTDERGTNQQLTEASNEAAHTAEENDESAQFKHSPVVRWVASKLHISVSAEYWVLYTLDFLIIALLVAWALKANLPAAFRARTNTIQKTMAEARTASEDANRRLGDIESRLAKLDSEIAAMRRDAETEAAAEEERIRLAAEHDRQRIVEAAHAEIDSAARMAQRELKAYAAELAVSLAEKRIQVDAGTDRALVQSFTRELAAGKDGH